MIHVRSEAFLFESNSDGVNLHFIRGNQSVDDLNFLYEIDVSRMEVFSVTN